MPDTSYDTARDRASARRAEENKDTDEYGLHKPAKSWTERLTDYAYPAEVAQATDKPWYADSAAFGAIPAGVAGHFMDNLSQVDTRGDAHLNWPLLGEMAHGEQEAAYRRERTAAEQQACDANGGSWNDPMNECNPAPAGDAPAAEPAAEPVAEEPLYTPQDPTVCEEQ